jgi:hypothetical protein
MKVGDRVLCIKDFSENHYVFTKNKIYAIAYIHYDNHPYIVAVAPIKYNRMSNEIAGKNGEHYWFSISWGQRSEEERFDQYFVDLKKHRKIKLEKINENR